MKRFIDLRGQDTGYRFTWWDTVRDVFESFDDEYAWNTWDEFEAAYVVEQGRRGFKSERQRYLGLCPSWVFEPVPDEDAPSQDRVTFTRHERIEKWLDVMARDFPDSDAVAALAELRAMRAVLDVVRRFRDNEYEDAVFGLAALDDAYRAYLEGQNE